MSSNTSNTSISQSNTSTSHRDDADISHQSNTSISQDNDKSIQQKNTNYDNNNNNVIKNSIKYDDESFASLRVLLQNEASPIYSCGRAYLLNLTKWCTTIDSNKLFPSTSAVNRDANQSKVVDGADDTEKVAVADNKGEEDLDQMSADDKEEDASSDRGELTKPTLPTEVVSNEGIGEKKTTVTLSEQPSNQHGSKEEDIKEDNKNNGDDESSCYSRFSEGENEDDNSIMSEEEASPDQNPTTLLEWRERVVSYFYDFADRKKWEQNTIINALAYLDTYCMSVCFPEQYAKIVRGRGKEELPPRKKQKTQEEISAVGSHQYKLAAITSLYLATKVYESSGNPIICAKGYSNISRQFTAVEIEEMELDILSTIGVQVNTPTSLRFIQELLPLLITRACDTKFSYDSMPWQPKDDIENSIYLGANYFAALASISDATDNPLLVSSLPSQIALAAIVEAADRVFYNKKLLSQQHTFHQRLFSMAEIQYSKEVRDIQKVLVDLKRLNEQEDDSSVEDNEDDDDDVVKEETSPTSIDCKENNVQSDSANDKENNIVVVSTPSKKVPPASMNQSSSACKQKNSCFMREEDIDSTTDNPTQDEVLYLRG